MAQPNKGSHGKPHVSAPIKGAAGSKSSNADMIKQGVHVKGIKGKGTK